MQFPVSFRIRKLRHRKKERMKENANRMFMNSFCIYVCVCDLLKKIKDFFEIRDYHFYNDLCFLFLKFRKKWEKNSDSFFSSL